MRSPHSRPLLVLAALLAVVTVAAAGLGSFLHTDDGCRIEVHCVSCRWHVDATPLVAPVLSADAVLTVVDRVGASQPTLAADGRRECAASRGPPRA